MQKVMTERDCMSVTYINFQLPESFIIQKHITVLQMHIYSDALQSRIN